MNTPIILILFGITGDLSKRKLLPALLQIEAAGLLPENLRIIGITRQSKIDVDNLLVDSFSGINASAATGFRHKLEILRLNPADKEDYKVLKNRINQIEKQQGRCERLYYISVPPQISLPIIGFLGEVGLARHSRTKLMLEKPFGSDLTSAQELIERVRDYFSEDQIYRIDHYLAKEMVQNILVFRQHNPMFQRIWHNRAIEEITVLAAESIGIEGRAVFYEQTGALRDIVQSHLMQLLALVLAELPSTMTDKNIQAARLAALKSLKPAKVHDSVRGQYIGYAEEVDNPGSVTETFAAITVYSELEQWRDVPLRLVTGKSLSEKRTEIKIRFKGDDTKDSNTLTIRVQPREGVELSVLTKQPGYERKVQSKIMSFDYGAGGQSLAEAYEQVLVDAIRSDKTLFATSEEIIEAWRVLEPVQDAWALGHPELAMYARGTDYKQLMTGGQSDGSRWNNQAAVKPKPGSRKK